MVLTLKRNDLLRLRLAAGSLIDVLAGHVWVTERGRAGDGLLGPGKRYRIEGNGLVLVGNEARADGREAEIAVRPGGGGGPAGILARLGAWLRARRTERELQGLSDHILRDIGLRREEIALVSRAPRRL
jgi:uncharacterized protein YjiS (DUF1127 family)